MLCKKQAPFITSLLLIVMPSLQRGLFNPIITYYYSFHSLELQMGFLAASWSFLPFWPGGGSPPPWVAPVVSLSRWFPWNVGLTLTSCFESLWVTKSKEEFFIALLGFGRSGLGNCLLCVWNGGKHLCTSDCFHGSDLKSSKQQKALNSCEFR